ncbi:methylmalonyl Co-A mutase-associated GTPase MeaB [Runella slithyformis]|uniref:LAO/AO transport system ATPase n=1 Tax=Runella slithyformis (strain ATCC 29530 / DSM 19594 / LMG 11500 / NCIMB 11436 / LSU 4) TaxID=761193 RepID=A0A7U3ZIU6_RUNSL|nr:methylmalonyl Co-A mutase-associated GTPase MeaB [Runella slithyformis]AEI48019.1 LAO/AO transport system ATPase [Runella slithyformis DSM 19594]
MKNRLSIEAYVEGVLAGNRLLLSRAITLIESQLPSDRVLAQLVLEQLLPHTGSAIRIGITGVPGVGKSTFIEAFGKELTATGKKLAVLAIDPTSQRSKGSIMGDKTRMEELSHDPLAYIRPSPSGGSLGGVANKTRETMLLCEAAGFEIIVIETVGVGQSETVVKGMVDFFLLLMLAGAGDELQGIKKGIMEMADAVVITKADGANQAAAQRAVAEYQNAFHLFPSHENGWLPPVLTCSAVEKKGLSEIWSQITLFDSQAKAGGFHLKNRQQQNLEWMHTLIRQTLEERFYHHPQIREKLHDIERLVQNEKWLPLRAATFLLDLFRQ